MKSIARVWLLVLLTPLAWFATPAVSRAQLGGFGSIGGGESGLAEPGSAGFGSAGFGSAGFGSGAPGMTGPHITGPGGGGFGPAPPQSPARRPATPYDHLVQVLSTVVVPHSWDEVGGPGTLQVLDHLGLIVVSQTPDVHEEIEALLDTLRKAKQLQGSETAAPPAPGPTSLPVGTPSGSKAEARIEAALAAETSLSFDQAPLSEFVAALADMHKIPILIDDRALEDEGLDSQIPVTVDLRGISLKSALRLTLRKLDLTWVIVDEVLSITTPEEAEARLVTRVYLVKDLAEPGRSLSQPGPGGLGG